MKKINDRRFQCRLDEEDLEDNNISLDDFFKNDTDKIHSLLEVIMEEAEKNIGVTLRGGYVTDSLHHSQTIQYFQFHLVRRFCNMLEKSREVYLRHFQNQKSK